MFLLWCTFSNPKHRNNGDSIKRNLKDKTWLKSKINVFVDQMGNQRDSLKFLSQVGWGVCRIGWNLAFVGVHEQTVLLVKCVWEPASLLWCLRQWWVPSYGKRLRKAHANRCRGCAHAKPRDWHACKEGLRRSKAWRHIRKFHTKGGNEQHQQMEMDWLKIIWAV